METNEMKNSVPEEQPGEEFNTTGNVETPATSESSAEVSSEQPVKEAVKLQNEDHQDESVQDEHEFSLNLFLKESVETGNFYFTPGTTANLITVEKGDSAKSVEMRLNIASNSYLEYKYTLRPGSYMVDYQVNMVKP